MDELHVIYIWHCNNDRGFRIPITTEGSDCIEFVGCKPIAVLLFATHHNRLYTKIAMKTKRALNYIRPILYDF